MKRKFDVSKFSDIAQFITAYRQYLGMNQANQNKKQRKRLPYSLNLIR
jgi:hypothetical protein